MAIGKRQPSLSHGRLPILFIELILPLSCPKFIQVAEIMSSSFNTIDDIVHAIDIIHTMMTSRMPLTSCDDWYASMRVIHYYFSDENVYNDCRSPLDMPWSYQRSASNDMELHITVEDVVDTSPHFSQSEYTVAVVRGQAPPKTIIKLQVRLRFSYMVKCIAQIEHKI